MHVTREKATYAMIPVTVTLHSCVCSAISLICDVGPTKL